jgi:hypothetical protein
VRRGTLAIGAGNMYAFKGILRVAQGLAQGKSVTQSFFKCGRPYAAVHWQLAKKKIKRFGVSHGANVNRGRVIAGFWICLSDGLKQISDNQHSIINFQVKNPREYLGIEC